MRALEAEFLEGLVTATATGVKVPVCGTAVWHTGLRRVCGGIGVLLGNWGSQAMTEAGVTRVTISNGVLRGVGPIGQRVVAFGENSNIDLSDVGVETVCFAALSVSDPTSVVANDLAIQIVTRWKELMSMP